MKKIIIALLLTSSALFSYSQDVDITWGKEEKITRNSGTPQILGIEDVGIIILKSDNTKDLGDYKIAIHDKSNYDQTNLFELDKLLNKEIKSNDLEEVFLFEKTIIFISSNKTELMATTMNLDGEIIKPRLLLARVDEKEKGFSGYEISTSPDKSKLLVIRKIDNRDKEKASYNFMVYDTDFKKLSSSKQVMPYDGKHFTFNRAVMTNSGDVYFSCTILIDGAKRKFDTFKSMMFMLNTNEAKPKLTDVVFPLQEKIYSSITFKVSDDEISINGLYAKSKTSEFLEGIFQLTLSRNGFNVINSTYLPFLKGLSSREGVNDKMHPGVSSNYKIDYIYTLENGEKIVILSSQYSYFYTSGNSTSKQMYSSDIIVMKISKENTIAYNTMVFKNQFYSIPYSVTINLGGIGAAGLSLGYGIEKSVYRTYKKYEELLSYALLFDGKTLNFIFNDHIKNKGLKTADDRFNNTKKSYCALVQFDIATGKWNKKALFNYKEEETLMLPKNFAQISDNEIITFAFRDGRSQSLGKVFIEKK